MVLHRRFSDGIGLDELPEKVPFARQPITDLPESPALSIIKNGPNSFKGRKLGIYIADGADADVVKALKQAAKDAGGHGGDHRTPCRRGDAVRRDQDESRREDRWWPIGSL